MSSRTDDILTVADHI